jgi:hypothetical protein
MFNRTFPLPISCFYSHPSLVNERGLHLKSFFLLLLLYEASSGVWNLVFLQGKPGRPHGFLIRMFLNVIPSNGHVLIRRDWTWKLHMKGLLVVQPHIWW